MSATLIETTPLTPVWADLGSDEWVSFPASWWTYLRLHLERGERIRPMLTYVDGRLTIVSPGTPHELYKKRLALLIEDLLTELAIDFCATGSVTLLKTLKPKRTGKEADESYYLTNIGHVRRKKDLLMNQDPAPDLVVEMVVSHPLEDALEAYREFGVREVWVCQASGLEFHVLGADGQYSVSPTSALLPFLGVDELDPWVFRQDFESDGQLKRAFRTWVTETLAPRHRPQG
jgi:Uma2 family endonuclease